MGRSLGDLIRLFGCPRHVILSWEKGLPFLAKTKELSGRREYSDSDVQALIRVRHLVRDRGLSLPLARETLLREASGPRPDARALLAQVRGELLRAYFRSGELRARLSGALPPIDPGRDAR